MDPPQLATCTYQQFRPEMGVPVRSTLGAPRFKLRYPLVEWAHLITPTRDEFQTAARKSEEFRTKYLGRLDQFAGRVADELAEIRGRHPGQTLVVLCFDDVHKPGTVCHRTLWAEWMTNRTGLEIPELQRPEVPKPASRRARSTGQQSMFTELQPSGRRPR